MPLGTPSATFGKLWADLADLGRHPATGGYRRYAWTAEDRLLREWFSGEAAARGLTLTQDRAGNQWAWWTDPDAALARGVTGVVVGSHLDSVPDGGAFDGPLGVVSAFAAIDQLRAEGFTPNRPIGIAHFGDEEGARFGIACAGSRLLTGALPTARALALADAAGVTMAEAMRRADQPIDHLGTDPETLRRVGCFVELHVEQGRALIDLDRPVAVGSSIWAHGRWRFDIPGVANHAGTTRLADRQDPMLAFAGLVGQARTLAERHDVLATCAKVRVEPNGVNAIPSLVTGWLDSRGDDPAAVRALVAEFASEVAGSGATLTEESWTDATAFAPQLAERLSKLLDDAPVLPTGAGHDAGILANAGIDTAMLFVRNPTGVSHSPEEHAELADCLAGVDALTATVRELAG